jgi:transcriptional regulator with XRE-family HTH domain
MQLQRVEDFYRDIGRVILRVREERGLTQEALAALVSLTRTSVTNIEKGRQRFLVHTLVDFARALGVQPSDLLPVPPPTPEAALDELLRGFDDSVKGWIHAAIRTKKSQP